MTQDETERYGTGHNGWDGTESDRKIWNGVGENRKDRTIEYGTRRTWTRRDGIKWGEMVWYSKLSAWM